MAISVLPNPTSPKTNRSIVAVKILKQQAPSEKTLESFAKEISLHSQIRHPHVLQFFGGCTQIPNLCLVTEYMFCSLQHALDHDYFNRMDALNYAIGHDDGQGGQDLEQADVVLVGVSRTSKTPTCIYLAHRGVRAANVPLVPSRPIPDKLLQLKNTLVVGLTISPDRLIQIRRNRLLSLKENRTSTYIDVDAVREEIVYARRLYERQGWPVIDVTRRSVEETAAAVMNLLTSGRGQVEVLG